MQPDNNPSDEQKSSSSTPETPEVNNPVNAPEASTEITDGVPAATAEPASTASASDTENEPVEQPQAPELSPAADDNSTPVPEPASKSATSPEPSEPAPSTSLTEGAAPETPGQPPVVSGGTAAASSAAPRHKRKWTKVLIIVLAAVVLIGGGSAFALLAVIIPNRPENVVVNAALNSAGKQQISYDGKVNYTANGLATLTQFTGASNFSANASDVRLSVTVSGVTVPLELRLVDKNIYVKPGDLTTLAALVNTFSPDAGSLVNSLAGQLSNKWIEIDSTLLQEAGLSCALNTGMSLTKADDTLLNNMYIKHRFVSATSEGSATINGVNTTKYSVSIDDNTAAAFVGSLSGLSAVKSLQSCSKDSKPVDTKSLADNDKTPLTVWVDRGDNEIVQIQTASTAKDAKSGIKGDATVTLNYTKQVNISAPQGAIPAVQLLASLAQSDPTLAGMLGGLGGGSMPTSGN